MGALAVSGDVAGIAVAELSWRLVAPPPQMEYERQVASLKAASAAENDFSVSQAEVSSRQAMLENASDIKVRVSFPARREVPVLCGMAQQPGTWVCAWGCAACPRWECLEAVSTPGVLHLEQEDRKIRRSRGPTLGGKLWDRLDA